MILKEKIKNKLPVFGTFNTLGSVSISKLIAASGLDFQILDLEHGPFNLSNINQHVCACHSVSMIKDGGCELLVRNPNVDRYSILQCMDQGADGLVIPHFEGLSDLYNVVKFASYPPKGDRSFSPYTNSGNYGGIPTSEIVSSSNTSKTFVFIVESLRGIDELPSILKVFPEFADVIYIGAYDLSADMGFHGQPRHPNVVQKIQEALKLCLAHSVSVGAYVPKSIGEVEELLDLGFTFITYNVDSSLLFSNYRDFANHFKNSFAT